MRSGTQQKCVSGNDPRHIHVPHGRPWLNAHASHELLRYDVTVLCRGCGGNSSGGEASTLAEPCNPAMVSPQGETEKNKYYSQGLDKLRQGKCPYYPPGWSSGHCGLNKFPPVELLLLRGTERCHAKCACTQGIGSGYNHERFIRLGSSGAAASGQNTAERQANIAQAVGETAARRDHVEAPATAGPTVSTPQNNLGAHPTGPGPPLLIRLRSRITRVWGDLQLDRTRFSRGSAPATAHNVPDAATLSREASSATNSWDDIRIDRNNIVRQ